MGIGTLPGSLAKKKSYQLHNKRLFRKLFHRSVRPWTLDKKKGKGAGEYSERK
jgi:hypothetical protein